jgi:hypothetical protein
MLAHVNAKNTSMTKLDTHINRIDAFIARLDTQFFLGAGINDIANAYFPLKIVVYGRSVLDYGDEMYFIIESNTNYSEAVCRQKDDYSLYPCTSKQNKIQNFFELAIKEHNTTQLYRNPPEGIKTMMSDLGISTPFAIINDASFDRNHHTKTISISCTGEKLTFRMDRVHISPTQAESVLFSETKIGSINSLCETINAHIQESKLEKWNYLNIAQSQRPSTYPGVNLGPSYTYNEASTLFQTDSKGRNAFLRIFICVFPKVASVEFTQTGLDQNVHLKFTENKITFSVFLDTDMNFRLKCI